MWCLCMLGSHTGHVSPTPSSLSAAGKLSQWARFSYFHGCLASHSSLPMSPPGQAQEDLYCAPNSMLARLELTIVSRIWGRPEDRSAIVVLIMARQALLK